MLGCVILICFFLFLLLSLCSLFFLCSLFLFYMLTPKKRLIQPPYRQPEYPLRERDSTRDLGPSGGSCGGMIHKNFTDQERLRRTKLLARPTLADNGTSPWNELATRHALMPEFRARPHKKTFRSSTAPAGFHLTDLNPKRPIMKSSALDEPWSGPLNPKTYAVHNDYPEKWAGADGSQGKIGNRFYSRSHVNNYQISEVERMQVGGKTGRILRNPGFNNSNVAASSARKLRSTLIVGQDDAMEWNDGSEPYVQGSRSEIGQRGYFASARAANLASNINPW